jgi:hypothetical protein
VRARATSSLRFRAAGWIVWFDTGRLYAPERWLVDEALRAFRLPLWNPTPA